MARRFRLRWALLGSAFLTFTSPLGAASVAYLVKDLNTQSWSSDWPGVGAPVSTGQRAVFGLQAGLGGDYSLWATDGTAAGTGRIRAIQPRRYSPPSVRVAGGALLNAATPPIGQELWWTDGTIAGTRLVRDIDPVGSSDPDPLEAISGLAFLAASDAEHGRELWVTDGTTAGTRLVADIQPGAGSALDYWPPAGVVADRLVFAADDGVEGKELWSSDGTAAGTQLLRSFVPGPGGGSPASFLAAGGLLYFAATDPDHGRELWATDGTPDGTRLVADIEPGPGDSSPVPIADLAGSLFFEACDAAHGCEPWITDGTPAGTRMVLDIQPGPGSSTYVQEGAVAGSSGHVVFTADDGIHGFEPWISDGTAEGTSLLADLVPGADGSGPQSFYPFDGDVLFGTYAQDGSIHLLATDGAAGVTDLGQVLDGADGFDFDFAPAGADLVFSAWWASYHWTGSDLWRTDGTVAGTSRIPLERTVSPTDIDLLAARQAGLVMTVPDQPAGHLYRSDGTESGTFEMTPPPQGGAVWLAEGALLADSELLFAEQPFDPATTCALWRTDGDQYYPIYTYHPSFTQDCPAGLTRFGDRVYFAADDGVLGSELWASDGTTNGTGIVRDIVPGYDGSHPTGLVADVDGLWFAALGGLWRSAGTAATTFEYPLSVSFGPWVGGIEPLGAGTHRAVFAAGDTLWGFDANDLGLEPVRFSPLNWSWGDYVRAAMGGIAYFFDHGDDGACELWRSDATVLGTWRVSPVPCAVEFWSQPVLPGELVVFGGRLYFQSCDPSSGCEPWTSDGTEAGTHLFADLDPGVFSSSPMDLTVVGDRLYFAACDAAAGCEPWVTDGSVAGTHRVDDIRPGPVGSLTNPRFTRWDRLVFFAADDGTGTELWAMPMELFYDGFETGDTSRWSP